MTIIDVVHDDPIGFGVVVLLAFVLAIYLNRRIG